MLSRGAVWQGSEPLEELRRPYAPKVYEGDALSEIAFPIGGIGAGSIALSGKGELIDWEILNRPNKSWRPSFTFFSIWAQVEGKAPVFRVMEGRLSPKYNRHATRWTISGTAPDLLCAPGLARMRATRFSGEYPFAKVEFEDDRLPVEVTLEAFNPLIPLNDVDSSLPVGIFHVTLVNSGNQPVEACLAFNLENVVGYRPGGGDCGGGSWKGGSVVGFRREDGAAGLFMETKKHAPESPRFGSLAVGTTWKDLTWQAPWARGAWPLRGLQRFCDGFVRTGRFDDQMTTSEPSADGETDVASLGMRVRLVPGEKARIPLVVAWHTPNFERYWSETYWDGEGETPPACDAPERRIWKNWYATRFSSAWETLRTTLAHLERLERETQVYRRALFGSTLPDAVVDAVASNISILRSPTCIRLEDGSVYGFEGACATEGSCVGSCTHVWNYAQALCWLFPKLERQMRENELTYSVGEDGHMRFRIGLPLDRGWSHSFHGAADGQMGTVLRLYREWLISGDDAWLGKLWPQGRKLLEYAWQAWDKDRDGFIEEPHHNTYDVEFHGLDPMANSMYLAALRAGERIARYLGEHANAAEYRRLFESGSAKLEELFNGEYYFQKLENAVPYQFGTGCLADQAIGQWFADMLDLGNLTREEHLRSALGAILRYNWVDSMEELNHAQRGFALNDEKGLLVCTWPRGGRPANSMYYSEEVFTGVEYQVASTLIGRGMVDEGLAIVKAARDRYRGGQRNPWDEVECGSHYARALASYAVMTALEGLHYSAPERSIQFAPKINQENFCAFFSVDSGWGTYAQRLERDGSGWAEIAIEMGSLELAQIKVPDILCRGAAVAEASVGREKMADGSFTVRDGALVLRSPVKVTPGYRLRIEAPRC